MPTLHREGGFRFYFHSHEPGEPAHVHVDGADGSIKFWLNPVSVARNLGIKAKDVSRISAIIRDREQEFLEAWRGYFGPRTG